MYKFLKKTGASIIPLSFLIQFEKSFRFGIGLFYLGTKYKCNVCNKSLRHFISADCEQMCPFCGSLQRNRRLWRILQNEITIPEIKILDFSPSRCLYRKMQKIKTAKYTATDFVGQFLAHKKLDITNIDALDGSFDLVICYHILEHITDDQKALQELYRIIKPNGKCILQTPFKEGEIYENPDITDPKQRSLHFGQEDHVRIYSLPGLQTRLEKAGFIVKILHFSEHENNFHGFKTEEDVIIAEKK